MARTSAETSGEEIARRLVQVLLLLFLLVCVFDPANRVVGAKVEVFVVLWIATLVAIVVRRRAVELPRALLIYVSIFVAVPALSILWYYQIDGRAPFEGFQLFKGYLLISLALVLFVNGIDLMPKFAAVCTALAVLAIVTFIYLEVYPNEFRTLQRLGVRTGTLFLDRRAYGPSLVILQVYYVTGPLMAFAIAYYFDRAVSAEDRVWKLLFAGLAALNLVGMALGGSRNNILAAALLPFVLWPIYTRNVLRSSLIALALVLLCALPFATQLQMFFDPNEGANTIKLGLISDYSRMFADPVTLLFGQGLGAYRYWESRGHTNFISELTYLELVRNFGLFGAATMMVLLLLPVGLALAWPVSKQMRALAVAFLLYLVMCASNPNLFSSMGVLILSILVANLAMFRQSRSSPAAASS